MKKEIRALISDSYIMGSKHPSAPKGLILIDENLPIYSGCIFQDMTIRITNGDWIRKVFISCSFKDCIFETEKNPVNFGLDNMT